MNDCVPGVQPTFSVIIPIFNGSSTIERTLNSLVAQSFRNFEVILVDDHSSDYSELLEAVEHYRTKLQLRVFRHETNMNGAAARNTGVEASRAPYIAFLDADDEWLPRRLEIVEGYLDRIVSKPVLIYGAISVYRGDRFAGVEPHRAIRADERVADYVFGHNQKMQTSTFVCSRQLALAVRFDERFTRHQDSSFAMHAQHAGATFEYVAEPLITYYVPERTVGVRIKQGRINSGYCDFWVDAMRDYLSRNALAGYNFYVRSRVLLAEGRRMKSFRVALESLCRFDAEMLSCLARRLLGSSY